MEGTFGVLVADLKVVRGLFRLSDLDFQPVPLNFGGTKLILLVLQRALKLLHSGTMGILLLSNSQYTKKKIKSIKVK